MESMRLVTRDISGESLGHREMEADQVRKAYYVFILLQKALRNTNAIHKMTITIIYFT